MWALVWAGCGSSPPVEQTWRMEDHAGDVLVAREAIGRGDLEAVHRAGEGLGRPDPAPGLPTFGREPLDRVRAGGKALAAATDLNDAAQRLGELTEPCAACHLAVGVTGECRAEMGTVDALWMALMFESDDCWQQGTSGVSGGPLLAAGRGWGTRRGVVSRLLASASTGWAPHPVPLPEGEGASK